MINIGKALKQQRNATNLSQNKLAKKIGIKQQNISRWEANENTPNIFDLITLADFYGITIDELIGRDFEYHGNKINNDFRYNQGTINNKF